MGASHYIYIEALPSQNLKNWIQAHTHAFTFLGGVPAVVIPDNLSGVTKADRYEPTLNPSYREMAEYHGVFVVPARSRKPRDKAKVEKAVKDVEQQILAPMRNQKFFSLNELNQELKKRLRDFNDQPFQKLPGSRRSTFEAADQPVLRPLPDHPYVYGEWGRKRVGKNYHIEVDGRDYSVPYIYVTQNLNFRVGEKTVDFFFKSKRVASHLLEDEEEASTLRAHRPPHHQFYADCTPEKLREEAEKLGPKTYQWVDEMLSDESHHP